MTQLLIFVGLSKANEMRIKTFVFNPFFENTYLLISEENNCIIIDPGCYEDYEINELVDYVRLEDLQVVSIINTHCHIDHVLGNDALKKQYGVPLLIPINEKEIFDAVVDYAPQWGIASYEPAKVDSYLSQTDTITLDEIKIEILEVPGHSPGHLVFYLKTDKVLIGGDVLFRESIGRTDLPGGNHQVLLTNIQEKIYALPEDVTVYPGHGPTTNIGFEKMHNPFVRG